MKLVVMQAWRSKNKEILISTINIENYAVSSYQNLLFFTTEDEEFEPSTYLWLGASVKRLW